MPGVQSQYIATQIWGDPGRAYLPECVFDYAAIYPEYALWTKISLRKQYDGSLFMKVSFNPRNQNIAENQLLRSDHFKIERGSFQTDNCEQVFRLFCLVQDALAQDQAESLLKTIWEAHVSHSNLQSH